MAHLAFGERSAFFANEAPFADGAYRAAGLDPHYAAGAELRGGVLRTVRCGDTVAWLKEHGDDLSRRMHVITSLPDIGELKPRLSPPEYEEWFVDVVSTLLGALDPSAVCIFYQTDGRQSGADGTYLDKSFLCHRGAHAAGAACLFHRIVCAGPLGLARGGHVRPSYAHMLCFSKALRPPRGALQWSDVLPGRGHMSYAGAMGEHACHEAVAFIVGAHRLRAPAPADDAPSEDAALPEREAAAPPLVFDPFCGHGSVLAMANAWGLDAFGIDINYKRCESSLEHRLRGDDGHGPEVKAEARGTAPARTAPSDLCRGCDGDHPHCRQS